MKKEKVNAKANGNVKLSEQKHSKYEGIIFKRNDCRACPIRNLCAGGCEVQRLNEDKNAKNQMCKLFLLEWKNLLYLYAKIKNTPKQ